MNKANREKGVSGTHGTLTPREIVSELDRYIVGQRNAKRSVAIALRNRWRRQQVSDDLRDEIAPKNIIMIGPTGVGKTEIARRLARLAQAPFMKIEASKFTEVGYVGRDVDSMIRDLTELGVTMVKAEETTKVESQALEAAEERILDLLLPAPSTREEAMDTASRTSRRETREKFRAMLREGKLDQRSVELETSDQAAPFVKIFGAAGMEEMELNIRDMFGSLFPRRRGRREMKVPEAMVMLQQEEAQKLLDMDKVIREAIRRVEQSGIIFLDEIDKVAGRETGHGPDVSREGVQRDLLPIIEGSTVPTKYGVIHTDHILFIAAGAFNVAKPSDLIPELQGRFPIRVELDALGKGDFIRILTEPKNSLIKQYVALMETEGVKLRFLDEAVEEIAAIAAQVNERTENIGARRLHTVMERLLDDISFDAPDMGGVEVTLDAHLVRTRLADILESEDLTRYIL